MMDQLPQPDLPAWLAALSSSAIVDEPFPLHDVLTDSLYYPSAGFDGDPVKWLAGNIYSFIYVDYGYTQDELQSKLNAPDGFSRYDLLGGRYVSEQELAPQGWTATFPTESDGDPRANIDYIKPPFCYWAVMQRRPIAPESHGPLRFSFIYLCADGIAAFQALYTANHHAPKAVAVIQPGIGFGFNWTDLTNPARIFARSVNSNPSGVPELLLYGGYGERDFYREPCWPDYGKLVRLRNKEGGGCVGIWRRSMPCITTSCR